jgi:hypothetical protein
MRQPLHCELHAHTTFSDGALSPSELVDLYGSAGFDVLAITDQRLPHEREPVLAWRRRPRALPRDARSRGRAGEVALRPARDPGARADLGRPPGAIRTRARGRRPQWIGVDDGLEQALQAAEAAGAALIGAHPYTLEATVGAQRTTARFSEEREWSREVLHRFELCNRHDFFTWVAEERLPAVARGDFHRPEHLATWKTLLPCAHEEEAVVAYLRSRGEAALTRLDAAVLAGREPARAA